jgi:hypothetical protein
MFDRFAAHRPPAIRNLSPRTRRFTIGTAAVVVPALLIGVLAAPTPARRTIAASSPARTR